MPSHPLRHVQPIPVVRAAGAMHDSCFCLTRPYSGKLGRRKWEAREVYQPETNRSGGRPGPSPRIPAQSPVRCGPEGPQAGAVLLA